jgi:LruC domain-containing protein
LILFEEARDFMRNANRNLLNTIVGQPFSQSDTINTTISLVSPMLESDFGVAPFNPFIFVDGRDREIHLPDMAPTQKHSARWWKASNDDSDPTSGRYYRRENNAPWAINIPANFAYPIEYAPIHTAHLKFMDWVMSNGSSYADWYQDKSGYRNASNIYR